MRFLESSFTASSACYYSSLFFIGIPEARKAQGYPDFLGDGVPNDMHIGAVDWVRENSDPAAWDGVYSGLDTQPYYRGGKIPEKTQVKLLSDWTTSNKCDG